MKRNHTIVLFAALALSALLLMAGCQEPVRTADLKVTLDEKADRTLAPADTDFNIASYYVKLTGSTTVDVTTVRSTFVVQGLPLGTYTISAEGRNNEGQVIVRGTSTFSLSSENNSATVTLNELVGTGSVNLNFTWDADLTADPSVEVYLKSMDSKESSPVKENVTLSKGKATLNKTGIQTGSYTITANLYDSGIKVAGLVEALRVGNNATVTADIPFNLDDPADSSSGQITLINNAGVPVVCRFEDFSEETKVEAQKETTIRFNISGLDESEVSILWYLDGNNIGTGTEVTFTPEPGKHRIDVVASTAQLGSAGSAYVTFEAELPTTVGLPVLAKTITSSDIGDIKISNDMLIEFMNDGNILLIDNKSKKAQVCSVIRNSLNLESGITMTNGATNVAKFNDVKLLITDKLDAATYQYTYNPSTGNISKNSSDSGISSILDGTYRFERVFGISRHDISSGKYGNVAVYGQIQTQSTRNLVVGFYNTSGSSLYKNYANLAQNLGDKVDVCGIDPDGYGAIFIGTGDSPFLITTTTYYDKFKSFRDETIRFDGNVTAAYPLRTDSMEYSRYVVAEDDTFRFFDTDNDLAVNKGLKEDTEGKMVRSEGSELNTVQLLTSADKNFLYAVNSGNNSISTYSVSDSGELAYIGMTSLPFSPQKAAISTDGSRMLVVSTSGTQLALLKVRT